MRFDVGPLPPEALSASAVFHADVLPRIRAAFDGGAEVLTLVFAPAGHDHRAWRLAALQTLARTFAPARINAVASDDERAIAASEEYLVLAPGVTGHYLVLDGTGAGPVV